MPGLASTIEAILYLKGQPLTIARLAELARCAREDIEEGLIELMDEYAHRDGALELVETADGYSLQLKERYRFFSRYPDSPRFRGRVPCAPWPPSP